MHCIIACNGEDMRVEATKNSSLLEETKVTMAETKSFDTILERTQYWRVFSSLFHPIYSQYSVSIMIDTHRRLCAS